MSKGNITEFLETNLTLLFIAHSFKEYVMRYKVRYQPKLILFAIVSYFKFLYAVLYFFAFNLDITSFNLVAETRNAG